MTRQLELETERGTLPNPDDDFEPMEFGRFENLDDDWGPRRELCNRMFDRDVRWRAYMSGDDSIFAHSNAHVPLTSLYVGREIARAQDYFLKKDSSAWFGTQPQNEAVDIVNPELHQFFLQFKAAEAGLQHVMREGIERTFRNGEAIMKGIYRRDVKEWESMEVVAKYEQGGKPLTDSNGDYIYPGDQWEWLVNENQEFVDQDGDILVYEADEHGEKSVIAITQEEFETAPDQFQKLLPENAADAVYRLVKDNSITIQAPKKRLVFERTKVWLEEEEFSGAKVEVCDWKNTFIPLLARNVKEADTILHIIDDTAPDIVRRYMQATGGSAANNPRFLELVRDIAEESTKPKADAMTDRHSAKAENGRPTVKIGEFWTHWTRSNGMTYDIMVVVDLERRRPIYYNYTANMTADKRRPFHVMRVQPKENRWWGESRVENFWGIQELMDTTFNRINFAQTQAGRIDIFRKDAFLEFQSDDPYFNINGGDSLTVDNTYQGQISDAIHSHYLNDIKSDDLMNLVQTMNQYATSMSAGGAGANDSNMQGLDTTKLKYGIQHIEMQNEVDFGPLIGNMLPGVEGIVNLFAKITIFNLEDDEDFVYYQQGKPEFGTLIVDDIQHVDYKIKIDLTELYGERRLAELRVVREAAQEFAGYPPEIQQQYSSIFVETAKLAGMENPEELFKPFAMQPQPGSPEEAAMMEEEAAMAEGQVPPEAAQVPAEAAPPEMASLPAQ